MSAVAPLRRPFGFLAPAGPAAKPAAEPAARPRPRLVLVAPARPAPGRFAFVVLIGMVLVGGLLLLLMLHTLAAQDGFTVNKLQQRLATLTDSEQGLEQQVQADSAPAALRARASKLGMVPSTVASYRKLHGGRVVGTEQPVYVPAPATTSAGSTTSTSGTKPVVHPTTAATSATTGGTTATGTTAATAASTKAATTKAGGPTVHKHHHHAGATSSAAGTAPTTSQPATPRHHHHATAQQ